MSTTDASRPLFEHDPLPGHTSHFRLLRIIRGDFGQHVECEISTWPISDAPPYLAISYTWGSPADTTEITINGKRLVVRRNCEYVLQQAFTSKTGEHFWVDAICIAQTTEEKNHQVGIMSQIYSGAKHVLACIGPHANDSEFLLKFIKKRDRLFRSIRGVLDTEQFDSWPNPIRDYKRVFFRCLLSVGSKTRRRLYLAFRSFIQRPYFTRIWVMQELHLATGVSYCFGTAVHAAEDFLSLHWLLNYWDEPDYNPRCTPIYIRPFFVIARYTLAYSRTKASKQMTLMYRGYETGTDLLGLGCTKGKLELSTVLLYTHAECTDPRDRLYGILSLVNWPDGQKPHADYQKDLFQVTLDAFKLLSKSVYNENNHVCAQYLCRAFRITGEEPSLRQELALRSNKLQLKPKSNGDDSSNLIKDSFKWQGFRILSSKEALESLSHSRDNRLKVSVSAQEEDGWSVLKLHGTVYSETKAAMMSRSSSLMPRGTPENMTLLAPLNIQKGDWWIYNSSVAETRDFFGFIVRRSESGTWNVVGQTFVGESSDSLLVQLLGDKEAGEMHLSGHWHQEDLLILGWSIKEVTSGEGTRDDMSKFLHRRICAWDGSSYFEEMK